jgi:hypothetical protein
MARKHGKKVQTHDSRAIPGQSILVDIRMDHGGRFSACWNEVWFDSLELPQLRKMLDAAIAKSGPTQWDLYIEIHEIGEPREESPWRNEERAKVVLDYKLLNLSQEITGKDPHYPGETTYRLCKKVEVEKDGKLKIADEITQYHEGDETVLLPYTAERWAALERLAETIEHVALQLRKLLFTAKPTAIAHTLDTIAPQRLLTALSDEPLPQKVKKR